MGCTRNTNSVKAKMVPHGCNVETKYRGIAITIRPIHSSRGETKGKPEWHGSRHMPIPCLLFLHGCSAAAYPHNLSYACPFLSIGSWSRLQKRTRSSKISVTLTGAISLETRRRTRYTFRNEMYLLFYMTMWRAQLICMHTKGPPRWCFRKPTTFLFCTLSPCRFLF